MILGFDEVGRGAWAGPLVVGACLLPDDIVIEGLNDSKLVSKKKRVALVGEIKTKALDWSLGWVSADEIDKIGLSKALKLATQRAFDQISEKYDSIIIDGTVDFLGRDDVTVLKKADQLVPSVSAASILAKVARDEFMANLDNDEKYGNYQFSKHVGYGTKLHSDKIIEFGVCDLHRKYFKPIQKIMDIKESKTIAGTTKEIGNWGEDAACNYLIKKGYDILVRNWKTKLFEIDIVAEKDDIIYVVEVKTRKNSDFGGGIAAINKFKLGKMQLAVETIQQKYPEKEVKQLAIFVTGHQEDNLIEFLEI